MPTQEVPRTIVSLRRGLIAFWCLVAVGCGPMTNAPTEDARTTPGPAAASTASAADDTATQEAQSPTPVAEVSDSTEKSIAEPPMAMEPEPSPPSLSAADVALEAPAPAVVASAATAGEELVPAPRLVPPPLASPAAAEPLDLSSLVTRLRKTKAINLRTKVAVKNESDDLLEQFRAYHTQNGATLADLRRSYDSLFHKLHSLLQDADPPLARDIDRSRAAIWEVLADPSKFSASHLMAGA